MPVHLLTVFCQSVGLDGLVAQVRTCLIKLAQLVAYNRRTDI